VAVRTGPRLTSAFHIDKDQVREPVQLQRNIAGVTLTAKSVTNWVKKHKQGKTREQTE
jgi:hypothetical protein